jgi:hypothetical protein
LEEIREGWRAYQLRETEALALSALWTCFLVAIDTLGGTHQSRARDAVVHSVDWNSIGGATTRLSDATATARTQLDTALALIAAAERCERVVEISEAATSALRVLLALGAHTAGDERFAILLEEGGIERWSVGHLLDWLGCRGAQGTAQTIGELVDALYDQHVRVAVTKLSSTDRRDPFCVRDDEGILRVIRMDEPLWTGARFATVNHVLWTLGMLTAPDGDTRPTEIGMAEATKVETSG